MKRLILFEPDGAASEELAAYLQSHNFSVTRSAIGVGGIAHMEAERPRFDIVMLDMSLNRQGDWDTLDQVHRLVIMHAPQVMILCFSRKHWGTRMRMRVERKHARFIYVR